MNGDQEVMTPIEKTNIWIWDPIQMILAMIDSPFSMRDQAIANLPRKPTDRINEVIVKMNSIVKSASKSVCNPTERLCK